MTSLFKNLLIALAIAVVIWLGYYFFIQKDDESEGAVNLSTAASVEAQSFLLKLQRLESIEIDGEIFSDPRFNALIDFRQEILQEPVGRDNPFAPIE